MAPHLRPHSPSDWPCLCQVIFGRGDPDTLHQNSADCDSFIICDPELSRTWALLVSVKVQTNDQFHDFRTADLLTSQMKQWGSVINIYKQSSEWLLARSEWLAQEWLANYRSARGSQIHTLEIILVSRYFGSPAVISLRAKLTSVSTILEFSSRKGDILLYVIQSTLNELVKLSYPSNLRPPWFVKKRSISHNKNWQIIARKMNP